MTIVIDRDIPFIQGVFESYASVHYYAGNEIDADAVRHADALIVRTRTRCDEALLAGSKVKIVATATIGYDHIDLDYCRAAGIHVQNAAGCNAGAVMNYVLSAMYGTASRKRINLDGFTVGLIGVGNVGTRVANSLRILGFNVLQNDPPRAEIEGPAQFCDLDYLLRKSDVVSMHVPLNAETRGMADAAFFSKMKLGAFFINAARGEIVNESALLNAVPKLGSVVIDTWCNEPDINRELLQVADIATPHIAGYSYQGKLVGTSMAVRAVARYLGIKKLFDFFPDPQGQPADAIKLDLRNKNQGQRTSILQYNYPIFTDDFMLRIAPQDFESLRANYRYRREFFID
ncbi:MAG: 4-phosphoerythronate dehydrogenase [Bacteroidales bacterium]|nr:4-phosphoerythronate dehydrogenase [Bacteroidales bacterium]